MGASNVGELFGLAVGGVAAFVGWALLNGRDPAEELPDLGSFGTESLAEQVEEGTVVATGAMATAAERAADATDLIERSERRREFAGSSGVTSGRTPSISDTTSSSMETEDEETTLQERSERRQEFAGTSSSSDSSTSGSYSSSTSSSSSSSYDTGGSSSESTGFSLPDSISEDDTYRGAGL